MNAHTNLPIEACVEPLFRVDWAAELRASSADEAACFAAEILSQETHTATIFSVTDRQTDAISVIDVGVDGVKGTNFPAKRPEDTTYTARSLRPGGTYQTRSGLPVEIVTFATSGDYPLSVRIKESEDSVITGQRTKAGLHPASKGDHPGDVIEVNPTITRWLKIYDRKLNENGKQVVSGKEFAANRGLFLYIFDTEEEARASLQGCRAIFPISYREGEGLG